VIRVEAGRLRTGLADLLAAAGMDADKAAVVAEMLVEADLIGHSTHGSGLAEGYLDALASGELNGSGSYEVVADRGACITWRGNRLPGAWLICQALDLACERAPRYGVVTVAIGGSHHTGALAAYLRPVTERGLVGEICCSTTSAARMAPFGGTAAVLTPNPLAIGFPTGGDPILIDLSASITTTTMTRTLAAKGERYPDKWALTSAGEPTDDPREVTERGGTLLPLGGTHKGHKGFGLALMVDVLTQGLADFGREDPPGPMSLAVFVQVIDPDAFGGRDAFARRAGFVAETCRAVPPAAGVAGVRVPGDGAARSRRAGLKDGVSVDETVMDALAARAARLGVRWHLDARAAP
jgi:LDH2 family malate/lactate/ureidoglycolate dehydrogenase